MTTGRGDFDGRAARSRCRLPAFLQLRWIDRERLVGYSIILFLASLPIFFKVYGEATGEPGSDFLAFWSAGKLVVAGAASRVYDTAATLAVQTTVGRSDVFAFVNPPPMLFLVAPLGLLDYPLAWVAWICATYAFWLYRTRKLDRELAWPIAAFPGALLAAWHAQTGLLTSGFQSAIASNLERRPFIAGLWAGGLIVKPHLAVLLPVAFLACRSWRAIAGTACSALGLLALAWLVFGTDTMLAYPQSWEVSRILLAREDTEFFLRQTTIYAAFRAAGFSLVATAAQAITSAVLVVMTWRIWSRPIATDAKLAFLFAATALATPYLFSYDLPFLIIPLLWLARQPAERFPFACKRPALVLLYLAPLACRALALPLQVNLTFLYGIALVALVGRSARAV